MDLSAINDEVIEELLHCEKRVKNPKARQTQKAKHTERNYEVQSADGRHHFTLIVRQSTVIIGDFTCGLRLHLSNGPGLMLTRYNGYGHAHGNPFEDEEFHESCHIHRATERYIKAGRKPEHYAQQTERYKDVNGALECLLADCKITGFHRSEEGIDTKQPNLFE